MDFEGWKVAGEPVAVACTAVLGLILVLAGLTLVLAGIVVELRKLNAHLRGKRGNE